VNCMGTAAPLRARWTLGALVSSFPLPAAFPQGPPELRLRPFEARVAGEFTRIVGLRELADGRVLVADEGENRLLVADFRGGSPQAIARPGAGPNEFQRVSYLLPLLADSTLMPDAGSQGRWLLIADAAVVATVFPQGNPFGARYALPLGADRGGRVFAALLPTSASTGPRAVDSLVLVAAHRVTRRIDTLTILRSGHPAAARAFGEVVFIRNTHENRQMARVARVERDEAMLFLDGWVAVVRRATGHVEWWTPDGRLQHPGDKPATTPGSRRSKPEYLDPLSPSLLAAPDGRVIVLRTSPDTLAPISYDVIDRTGRTTAVLRLGRAERLVGLGRHWAYSSVLDEDGLQHLRRHPWP